MTKPISFAFSTYNRPTDALDLLKNILALDHADIYVEDIVIVNNGSTTDYAELESYINEMADARVFYHKSELNEGATGGKNKAFYLSKGAYVIMPDDDCIMANPDCLKVIVDEFENMNTEREKAIVVFKLVYFENKEIQWEGFPHKNFKKYGQKSWFQTYFFPGGACAFKRSCIDNSGFYLTDISFAQEEFDLALRLVNGGYCFVYTDKVTVWHKESPLERFPAPKRSFLNWVNKSRIAYKYLPLQYFFSTGFFWMFQHLKESKWNIKFLFPGIRDLFKIPLSTRRQLLNDKAMNYLRQVEARLWY
ncbi:MAG: glycosyltransferase family 2 protein [Saprospiraceae bacterium]